MKISFKYLINFYLHNTTCEKYGIKCNCFSSWLRNVYELWHMAGYVKKNLLNEEVTEEETDKNISPKKYDLKDMVKLFNEIPDRRSLEYFFKEIDEYYLIKLGSYNAHINLKMRAWYDDNKNDLIREYKNPQKLAKKCPYI